MATESTLAFTGNTNEYAGELVASEAGEYTLEVTAFSAETGNAGWQAAPIRVN